MIEQLTGDGGMFPSRSELIRVAVREFLIKEMATVEEFERHQTQHERKPINSNIEKIGEITHIFEV